MSAESTFFGPVYFKEYLWIENRSSAGFDSYIDSRAHGGALVHLHRANVNGGYTILKKTVLVDTTPNSTTSTARNADFLDAAIVSGNSFYDPYGGITISHLGIDATGNITVDISVDADKLDRDEDGVRDSVEALYGTNPDNEDTDGDGLLDFVETCYDGDCTSYNPYPAGGDLNATNADTDGDGMPDGWEISNVLLPLINDAGDDPDNDGLSNLDEFLNGTNPKVADTDGDGVNDGNEVLIYGTDPTNADTDGDGMTDGWEVNNELNPFVDDSALDPDGDSLSNLEEFHLNTNPHQADTDGDGLSDSEEVYQYHTNPIAADTDGDRLSDGEEVLIFGTDPLSYVDSDFDGMSDDWEFARGTDPAVNDARVDSDGDSVDNVVEYLRRTLPLDASSVPDIRTLYVDQSNTTGVEYGSPKSPFSSISVALTEASHGDTISLASGTYSLNFFYYTQAVNIVGPADHSAVLSAGYFAPVGQLWGGVENVTLLASNNYIQNVRNYRYLNSKIRATQGTTLIGGSRVIIENCVVDGANNAAITVNAGSGLNVVNSTIAGNPTGVSLASVDAALSIRNAILSNETDLVGVADGSSIRYSLISDGQFVGENGNIGGDPLFSDVANGDYRVLAGSPAIDAGDPADTYAREPEPNGCRINMGAFGNTAQATTSADPDGDGLHGHCEQLVGTDPNHFDSDHDGVSDGAEMSAGTNPMNLFDPAGEGMNLAADAGFTLQGSSYLSTDTLHILAWSNLVGSGAGTASYTVTGGGTVLSGTLASMGDGSYRGSVSLGTLNYIGSDVVVEVRLQQKKQKYQAQRTISVSGDSNSVPVVTINTPVDGSSHDTGASITFSGNASDAEDGDLTASLEWTSSLDGVLGVGGDFSRVLSDGAHSITAIVTDSGGRVANQVVSVMVGTVSEPITLIANGYKVKGLQVVDLTWSGVSGSQVSIYRNGALVATVTNSGTYTDNIAVKGSATYLYSVCEAGTSNCSSEVSVTF
jgi:hypothetical protein